MIGMLKKLLTSLGQKKRHHDLDSFFGSWTAEEAAEIDKAIAEQRRPNPKPWHIESPSR